MYFIKNKNNKIPDDLTRFTRKKGAEGYLVTLKKRQIIQPYAYRYLP